MFSGQDVDRELRSALSVSPSPDFEARVLQRIDADRQSHWPGHYGWLAAAASVLIAAGAFLALNGASDVAPLPAAPPIAERAAAPSKPLADAARIRTAAGPRPEPGRVSRGVPRTAPRSPRPDVIVPADRLAAVHRLVREVNAGRIEPLIEPLQDRLTPAPLAVIPIVVEPILVLPLDPDRR